jgi:hypothetical protein
MLMVATFTSFPPISADFLFDLRFDTNILDVFVWNVGRITPYFFTLDLRRLESSTDWNRRL